MICRKCYNHSFIHSFTHQIFAKTLLGTWDIISEQTRQESFHFSAERQKITCIKVKLYVKRVILCRTETRRDSKMPDRGEKLGCGPGLIGNLVSDQRINRRERGNRQTCGENSFWLRKQPAQRLSGGTMRGVFKKWQRPPRLCRSNAARAAHNEVQELMRIKTTEHSRNIKDLSFYYERNGEPTGSFNQRNAIVSCLKGSL